MWDKIKSAAKWLRNKIVAGLQWLGIKLGIITAISTPAAAETITLAEEKKPAVAITVKSPSGSNVYEPRFSDTVANLRHYSELPSILKNIIFSFFNQRDLSRVNRAHGWFYLRNSNIYSRVSWWSSAVPAPTAFSAISQVDPLACQFSRIPLAGKLLNTVIDADYRLVAVMIVVDPSLMFEPVNFIYRDGSSERISPLKYAFKVYDTYMWKLFYERIKNNPDDVKQFLRQAQEQTTHITLEPLFEAYQEYERQCQRWLRDEITESALDGEWFKLGKVQKARLPVHMLKEFSREGDTWWDKNQAFDVHVTPAPRNCRLHDYGAAGWRSLSFTLLDLEWGVTFSLARAVGNCARRVGWARETAYVAPLDLATFRRLFEVRTDDLARQLSLLLQNFPENRVQQDQSLSSSSANRVTPSI